MKFLSLAILLASAAASVGAQDDARWWPEQKLPRAVVRATLHNHDGPEGMLTESLAGLAAQAVNEDRGDEMVWIATSHPDYEDWYARALKRFGPEVRGELAPWELVDRFARKGVVRGYILYRQDTSKGATNDHRRDMDLSVNVATSMAGLLGGVIVDESLEAEAKAHGLELLLDARDKTQQWVFDRHRDSFNRRLLCTQDPRKPHARDLAIAQKAITVYGDAEPVPSIMAWLDPLSPVLGWNGGDERETTMLSSIHGQVQTSTDWCMNLPLLMAGTEQTSVSRVRQLDPDRINWEDKRHATSFVVTDGDNVQWYMGGIFRGQGDSWYGSPLRGSFPFGWSCCFAHLTQLAPEVIDYAVGSQTANDTFVEWGGGYFYPDHFARKRANPDELLARHARRTWAQMRKAGTRIIAFNFTNLSSAAPRRACEIYAREMDGLLGILAFEYDAYEGGAGRVLWVKDRRGMEVPVVAARYSVWEHHNERPRSGTPAKVAREIRQVTARADKEGSQNLDWVITHAWSYFRRSPDTDEKAEDMPQANASQNGGVRGYAPASWCVERLPANVRVVSPEELLWRIRMQHHPGQTRALIDRWSTQR